MGSVARETQGGPLPQARGVAAPAPGSVLYLHSPGTNRMRRLGLEKPAGGWTQALGPGSQEQGGAQKGICWWASG